MKPEEQARVDIDRLLEQCGWIVQDRDAISIAAGPGVAVREFPTEAGPVDYLLYVDGKAAGTVEAKAVGHTLSGVEVQSEKYDNNLDERVPSWSRPLPFSYQSTGVETKFTNRLDPLPRSREVFAFPRPEELRRLAELGHDGQVRARLKHMPPLDSSNLWSVQVAAINSLERSLAENRPRALIQMATGSGKTFTACNFTYRLARFAGARRILFLVDRNTLGRQAQAEFDKFISPHTNRKFPEEYVVQHLRRNTLDPASKVVITTIQRLYSILKGEEEYDEGNEEGSLFESAPVWRKEPLPVAYNPRLPPEAFDFIIVDECHRSIYNLWRQALEYFDAFLIGLTATPDSRTVGFFDNNVVQDYSHEKAVGDGVNVGFGVYRIRTKIGATGAVLEGSPEFLVPRRDRRTRQKKLEALDEDIVYAASQLDRDVVNPSQIRTVIRAFRDRLFTEIFPGRSEVPKTLVFAKTDNHAEDIVQIIREEFGRGNEFCQKITSKTTGRKPEEVLSEFRNSFNPRVAVTVDMIATGTDVKPLECLLFMRDIKSSAYFEQMKGRGCRVVRSDDLQAVTPDAREKDRFIIVDAVGVCESEKNTTRPLDAQPSIPFKKLVESAGFGVKDPDLASALAARLARMAREISPVAGEEIAAVAGRPLAELAQQLLDAVDPDANAARARAALQMAPDADPSEEAVTASEQAAVEAALKPFLNPKFRQLLIGLRQQLDQVIDEVNQDVLTSAGFDAIAQQKARSQLEDFRKFLEDHREEIEAVRLLYSRPYRAGLRYEHVRQLEAVLGRPPLSYRKPVEQIWGLYQAVEPQNVREKRKDRTARALVDLIALVRHALHPAEPIVPLREEIDARYREWLAAREAAQAAPFTPDQRRMLDAIRDHIAESLSITPEDFSGVPFSQMGGLGRVVQLFGEGWPQLLEELNERLAA